MKKAAIIMIAVTALFCIFLTGCGDADDGKITENANPSENVSDNSMNNAGQANSGDTDKGNNRADSDADRDISDAVSDVGQGAEDLVSDAGDMVSDAADAVSDAGHGLEDGAEDIADGR
ncbi:MAG: hypothetical protein J1F23_02220 [Oscillospiraceae bacterium]|nr:hypothetical protein [Oscillospiraceae bacterium]